MEVEPATGQVYCKGDANEKGWSRTCLLEVLLFGIGISQVMILRLTSHCAIKY